MSRLERYGTRDLTFSNWHRSLSDDATCIDIDFCEYCSKCRKPLALIELARDVGQAYKPTTVLANLAKQAGIPAYLILYSLDPEAEHGIGACRVRTVAPKQTALITTSIAAVGRSIERIHSEHKCDEQKT